MSLKAQRVEILKEAKAVQAKALAGNRDLTDAEVVGINTALEKVEQLDKQIAALEVTTKLAALEAPVGRVASPEIPNVEKTSILTHERVLDNPTKGYDGRGGFGVFAADVAEFNAGRGMSKQLQIASAAGDGMQQLIKSDGGVLVPPAFSTMIQEKMDLMGFNLVDDTDQLPPLPANVESMEYPTPNETSRADGSRAGGIQARWKSELTQMTESKPTLKSVKFEPQELYVFAYISDKLLRHAAQLEAYLSNVSAKEILFKCGDGIINGTGSGQPRGILTGATDAPRVQIAKETGQAAATIVKENIDKMFARFYMKMLSGAAWYVNQDVWPQLLKLQMAVGTGGLPVFLPAGNIAGAPFGTLYGLPIKPIEYCATLGTEGDIILANLKMYGTQSRGTVEAGMSIHLKFDYNQTAFRFIFEMDGQPWISSSITPFKGSNKISPFVTLATRS